MKNIRKVVDRILVENGTLTYVVAEIVKRDKVSKNHTYLYSYHIPFVQTSDKEVEIVVSLFYKATNEFKSYTLLLDESTLKLKPGSANGSDTDAPNETDLSTIKRILEGKLEESIPSKSKRLSAVASVVFSSENVSFLTYEYLNFMNKNQEDFTVSKDRISSAATQELIKHQMMSLTFPTTEGVDIENIELDGALRISYK